MVDDVGEECVSGRLPRAVGDGSPRPAGSADSGAAGGRRNRNPAATRARNFFRGGFRLGRLGVDQRQVLPLRPDRGAPDRVLPCPRNSDKACPCRPRPRPRCPPYGLRGTAAGRTVRSAASSILSACSGVFVRTAGPCDRRKRRDNGTDRSVPIIPAAWQPAKRNCRVAQF